MVKTSNNPQGQRVLVNELVAGLCLDFLEVKHPPCAVIDIPPEVITNTPEAKFSDGTPLAAGKAFGSELWQSDPQGVVDTALITNKTDVAGTAACDTWVGQNDSRQYRTRPSPAEPGKYEFFPVDQGHVIGSPNWTASEIDARKGVVVKPPALPVSRDEIEGSISKLRSFTPADAHQIVSQIPSGWLDSSERDALQRYLTARAQEAADALDAAYPTSGSTSQ